ncbi:aldehyde dehydrogenase family 3 member B1-like [Neophocaena asiaeorientalis asiaeorientalis]|uniref:Aldehyde dehydrogenase n=1 Tax=Neophocaena asiaeorientalis asiaeorientalis TaxID=1706337 RepID=A0A341BTY3_NEOAA|nr:aldehyde dehydrogenase family 3 member B1-like [Neophocaena asiaeorientalis asiaeorientalis]
MDRFADTLQRLREAFDSGCTRPAEFRAAQLKGLSRFLQENKQLLQEALVSSMKGELKAVKPHLLSCALMKEMLALAGLGGPLQPPWAPPDLQAPSQVSKAVTDFETRSSNLLFITTLQDCRQSAFESEVSEISISQNEINLALRNLRAWMKDEKVPTNLATQLDSAFIRKEPFGLVLVIAPWNYPLNLSLEPLVGALAAGHWVVLKPSEISKGTEKVLAEVLPRYLDQSCFAVVLGGPQETGQLLEHKFDYIFFTGEEPVWGLCRMGEVRSLPSPTLRGLIPNSERGTEAASQPGRMQTGASAGWCSRPQDELASLPLSRLGSSPRPLGTLGRDGPHPENRPLHHSQSHTSQHLSLLGSCCARRSFLRPRPFWRAGQMRVWGLGEPPSRKCRREKPLALYAFSNSSQVVKRVLAQTSSGGFCGNDGFMHMTVASLPFGGVGASGMGSYHGKFSFDTFSHHRACLLRRPGLEKVYALRYPPHTPRNLRVLLAAMETRSCSCALL